MYKAQEVHHLYFSALVHAYETMSALPAQVRLDLEFSGKSTFAAIFCMKCLQS